MCSNAWCAEVGHLRARSPRGGEGAWFCVHCALLVRLRRWRVDDPALHVAAYGGERTPTGQSVTVRFDTVANLYRWLVAMRSVYQTLEQFNPHVNDTERTVSYQ